MGGRARRAAILLLLISVILAAMACTRPKPKEAERRGPSEAEEVVPGVQPTPEGTMVSVEETLTPPPTFEVLVGPLPTAAATWPPTAVLTSTPEERPQPPESYATHIVQPGETLFSLGQKYGVSWERIAQVNGISYPYWIVAGQKLTIPRGEAPVTPAGERIHIVQRNETLYSIGLRYGVSWRAIADANGIVNPNQIFVGQTLVIP